MDRNKRILGCITIILIVLVMTYITVRADTTIPGTFEPLPTGYKMTGLLGGGADEKYSAVERTYTEFSPSLESANTGYCSICGASVSVSNGRKLVPVNTVDGTKVKAYYIQCMDLTDEVEATWQQDSITLGDNFVLDWVVVYNNSRVSEVGYKHKIWYNETVTENHDLSRSKGTLYAPHISRIHYHITDFLGRTYRLGTKDTSLSICNTCANKLVSDSNAFTVNKTARLWYYPAYGIAPIKYRVRYDSNGGTGTMADTIAWYQGENDIDEKLNCYYYNKFKLRKCTFTKVGCTFKGWNTKADGTGKYFVDGSEFRDLSHIDNDVITLYAQWDIPIKVKFDTQGGYYNYSGTNAILKQQRDKGYLLSLFGAVDKWLMADDGTSYGKCDDDWDYTLNRTYLSYVLSPQKDGSYFKGWYTESTGGICIFDSEGKCMNTAVTTSVYFNTERTLYAQYGSNIKITFDTGKGEYLLSSYSGLRKQQVEKGYIWCEKGNSDKYLFADDGTAYSFWEYNDWDNDAGRSKRVLVACPGIKNELAEFKGWFTKPSGGVQAFDSTGHCVIKSVMQANYFTNNTTLYAQFEEAFKITLDTQGGSYDRNRYTLSSYDYQINDGYLWSMPGNSNRYLIGIDQYASDYDESKWNVEEEYYEERGVCVPERTGSLFKGWFTEPVGGIMVFSKEGKCKIKDVRKSNYFTKDTTLYAQYYPEYTVSIQSYGASYYGPFESQSSRVDESFVIRDAIYKNNYFYHSPSDDMEYGIYCRHRGVSGYDIITNFGTKYWSDELNRSEYQVFPALLKYGYVYKGIFTEPMGNGDMLFDEHNYCVDKDLINGTKFDGDITVYAYLMPLRFNITWEYNKPQDSSSAIQCDPKPDSTTVEYTIKRWSDIEYPSPALVGWKFLGWYSEDDTRYDTRNESIALAERKDIVLSAKWERIEMVIRYDGGETE